MEALRASGLTNINVTFIDGMPWIENVHDPSYLDFFKRTSEHIDSLVPDSDVKKREVKAVYPSVHPYISNTKTNNPVAQRGLYMFDTYTPIMREHIK